jgi:hypothetical protein
MVDMRDKGEREQTFLQLRFVVLWLKLPLFHFVMSRREIRAIVHRRRKTSNRGAR